MPNTNVEIEKVGKILAQTKSLLVITGAGISAESGLRTFRGPNGVFVERPELERVLSADGLASDSRAIWEFMNEFRILAAAAKPNDAHRVLARWEQEKRFAEFLIATQNIDGLHQAAGSQRVSQLHGSAWQIACPRETEYAADEEFSEECRSFLAGSDREALLRKWSEENNHEIWEDRDVPFRQIPPYADARIRPNVLLFDELYGNRLLWVEAFIARKPNTVVVIGCSGTICVLERLLDLCWQANPDCHIININTSESSIAFDHIDIRMTATDTMNTLDSVLRRPSAASH